MKPTIQIAIADDHALFRSGLNALLSQFEGLAVVAEAANGKELLQKISENPAIDIVLLDISMPEMDGIEALKAIKQNYPAVKVIMLTMIQDDAMILHFMTLGANSYLLKECEPQELEWAIRSVMQSGFYFNERVSTVMLNKIVKGDRFKPQFKGNVSLTDREFEVLECVCKGLTNPEIGDKLFISPRTVEGHRKNIMEKMGVTNTAGMVVYAIKKGWVDVGEL